VIHVVIIPFEERNLHKIFGRHPDKITFLPGKKPQ